MAKNDQLDNNNVCPWCHSEIVWDEEIGPEEHCPHCSNELSGYRTLQVGIEQEESEVYGEEASEQHQHQHEEEEDDWASDDTKNKPCQETAIAMRAASTSPSRNRFNAC